MSSPAEPAGALHEPASVVTLLAILALSVALDLGWKRRHARQAEYVAVGH